MNKHNEKIKLLKDGMPIFEKNVIFAEKGLIVKSSEVDQDKMVDCFINALSKDSNFSEMSQKLLLNIFFNSTRKPEGWRWDIDVIMYYWMIRSKSGHLRYLYLRGEMKKSKDNNKYELSAKEGINRYCPSEEILKNFTFKPSCRHGIDKELFEILEKQNKFQR